MIPALSILGPIAAQMVGDVTGNAVGVLPQDAPSSATDFGTVLAQVSNDAVSKLKTGEATAISGIEGHASVQQVVESMLGAQQALQTAVAIRDKLVSAYQEVSRMAI